MFKKIMLLILCIALCFSFSSCALKKGIVSVDGSNVDEAYFKYYFTTLKNTIQTQQGEDSWQDATLDGKPALEYVRERAMQSVIDEKIIMLKVKEDNIQLDENDLNSIKNLKQQWINQYGNKKNFVQGIYETYGISEKNFDYMMEAAHYKNKVMDKYVIVEEQEVSDFYTENIAKVKHILIATVNLENGAPLSTEELSGVNEKVERIKEELSSGADFDELIEKYTQDRNAFYYVGRGFSLDDNGAQSSSMVPEFEEASFALKTGEISQVVESAYGYHIIKRYNNDNSMLEKAKETLSYIIKVEKFSEVIDEWRKQMNIVVNNEIYNSYK